MTAKKTTPEPRKATRSTPAAAPRPVVGLDPRTTGATGLESQVSDEQRRALAETGELGVAAAAPTPTNETAVTALEPGIAGNEGGLQPQPEVVRRRLISDPHGKEKMVRVRVPKAFRLTDADGEHHYAAGEQDMPESHVDHWYAKANGVEAVKTTK